MRDSGLNEILSACQDDADFLGTYTDKGFSSNTHITAAHHGPGPVTELQKFYNFLMSPTRVCIECGFGKVYQTWPILRDEDILKLGLINVARYVRVAFIMTNAHTCMNESLVGLYFNCPAPSLQEYFSL